VRKHLMEDFDDVAEPDIPPAHVGASADGPGLAPGEAPPYDSEAT
jgi:hypothetical protein